MQEHMQQVRALAADRPAGTGVEWVRLLWATNELAREEGQEPVFGRPTKLGEWRAGGFVEEYGEARIILPEEGREDEGVRIVPLTDRAGHLIHKAYERVKAEG